MTGLFALPCALSLLFTAGCKDETPAYGSEYESIPEQDAGSTFGRELCFLMLEGCDCSRQLFTMDQCVHAFDEQLQSDFAEARAAGLTYDAACMAEYVNLHTQELGCSTISELSNEVLSGLNVPTCKVHSGTLGEGEMCQMYPLALGDDCAPELRCVGVCQAVPSFTARVEGEACDPLTDLCEPGTACLAPADDPTSMDLTCARLPGEGQPCTVGCDVGLTCDIPEGGTERQCLAPPPVGQPCGFPIECADGAYCNANVCTPTLAEGEPCSGEPREACGIGFECDETEESDESGVEYCVPEEAYLCI